MILWSTIQLFIAQVPAVPAPTGNANIDTLVYVLGGIASAMGLREGTYWFTKLRKKAEDTVEEAGKLVDHVETIIKTQEKMVETLTELNTNIRLLNQRIMDTLGKQ